MIESQSDSTIRSLRFDNLRTACSAVIWRSSHYGLILGHCMATPYHRDILTRPTDWGVFCPSDGRHIEARSSQSSDPDSIASARGTSVSPTHPWDGGAYAKIRKPETRVQDV